MLSVVFILAATLTLLPAVLAKLGPRVDKLALPWAHSGEHRSRRFAAWGERLRGGARSPSAHRAVVILVALATPRARPEDRHAVDQGRARRRRLARRPTARSQQAFGPGAPGALQVVAPAALMPRAWPRREGRPRASRRSCRPSARARDGDVLVQVIPAGDPSDTARRGHHRTPATDLPAGGARRRLRRREPRPGDRAERRRRRWSSASCSRSASCFCSSRCRRRSSPPSASSRTCWPSARPSASAG